MGTAVYDELFRRALGLVEKDVVPDRAIRACLPTSSLVVPCFPRARAHEQRDSLDCQVRESAISSPSV